MEAGSWRRWALQKPLKKQGSTHPAAQHGQSSHLQVLLWLSWACKLAGAVALPDLRAQGTQFHPSGVCSVPETQQALRKGLALKVLMNEPGERARSSSGGCESPRWNVTPQGAELPSRGSWEPRQHLLCRRQPLRWPGDPHLLWFTPLWKPHPGRGRDCNLLLTQRTQQS